jgi:hypothetical protein
MIHLIADFVYGAFSMPTIVLSILMLAIYSVVAVQDHADPKPAKPTEEQLLAATKAFAKIGEVHRYLNAGIPVFEMHRETKDEDLKRIPKLQFAFGLILCNTKVTDVGMRDIANLKNLTKLDLLGTQVTDTALNEIAKLKNLTSLELSGDQVTDAGMKEIASLTKLTKLRLFGTKVTASGMKEIGKLDNLTYLDLFATKG